jgi:hypothetical protein
MDLGIVHRRNNDDFVSVRNATDIRLNLKRLFGKRYIAACDYCDNSQIFPLIKVIPGEQARPIKGLVSMSPLSIFTEVRV